MADMNMPQRAGKRKLQTPRIDFTPMIDLGFLLITFFMYTTTLAKPATMEINMPSDSIDTPPTISAENTITLIATKEHKIAYYEGILSDADKMQECSFTGVRAVLLRKKNIVASLPLTRSAKAHNMYVLIKANDDCTYGDVVQLLDEMTIDDLRFYTIADVTSEEKYQIQKKF